MIDGQGLGGALLVNTPPIFIEQVFAERETCGIALRSQRDRRGALRAVTWVTAKRGLGGENEDEDVSLAPATATGRCTSDPRLPWKGKSLGIRRRRVL